MAKQMYVLQVAFHAPGAWKRADAAAYAAAQTAGADEEHVRAHKLVLESPALVLARRAATDCRRRLARIAVGRLGGGTFVVPLAAWGRCESVLAEAKATLAVARKLLREDWPNVLQRARERLGSLYDPDEMPGRDEAALALRMSTRTYAFEPAPTPEARAQFEEALDEIRAGLRAGFAQVVEELRERVEKFRNGLSTRIDSRSFAALQQWLELFQVRNVTDDADLAELVDKARALVASADPQVLRENTAALEQTVSTLRAVAAEATALAPSTRQFEV